MKRLKYILLIALVMFFWGCTDDTTGPGINPAQLLDDAWSVFESGEYEVALEEFEHAYDKGANPAGCLCGMGWCNFRLGEITAAEINFQNSVSADNNYFDSYAGLVFISSTMGNFDDTIEAGENVMTLAGDAYIFRHDSTVTWWDVRLKMAQAYFHTADYISCYEQIQILDPLIILDPDSETFIEDLLTVLETLIEP